ncbi:MAG TPA: beta-N-acetylglucosaminidase domain-containing protein [Egibacteraceae bacterium]|nr:beta-N-acetylglucosaminidase domain-containing protein [Egibacteraceae bacterium]
MPVNAGTHTSLRNVAKAIAVAALMLAAAGCPAATPEPAIDAAEPSTPAPSEAAEPSTPAPSEAVPSDVTPSLGSGPMLSPAPQHVEWSGTDIPVEGRQVRVLTDAGVSQAAVDLVIGVLERAGAAHVEVADADVEIADADAGAGAGEAGSASADADSELLTVRLGLLSAAGMADELSRLGLAPPGELPPEGYALAVGGAEASRISLAGSDADGAYYAAQTLRQLVIAGEGPTRITGARIVDFPSMALRGTIEGFFGSPWTHAERMDQLAFYGDVKMNTYIYAPKDDPYHRDRWREPYPADKLAELSELIAQAAAHHVDFTFALSPGVSICYSSEADYETLVAKLHTLYEAGVRAFSIPLDDLDLDGWHWACAEDAAAYGASDERTHGRAQVDLLNRIQRDFLNPLPETRPLQMVPTQYDDLADTAYKAELRSGGWNGGLDERIVVMWTGTDVVPTAITNAEAATAASASVFGRKVFVWDNYPVNDYGRTTGRLLLGSYQRREAGLSEHLVGIVSNPMNQAAASKVALWGLADFTWNDHAYDPDRAWTQAARYLAGGDETTAAALLVFFDLSSLAPSWSAEPWIPQAAGLAARVDEFWARWRSGEQQDALEGMRPHAVGLAEAPATIRSGVRDELFLADAGPWLDATALWGQALTAALDAAGARTGGDEAEAARLFSESDALAEQAAAIQTIPGETRTEGPVLVGDGVLDVFLDELLVELR